MSVSPRKNTDGVVKLTVSMDGAALADTVEVYSVRVEKRVNGIPRARIVLIDGDMPNQDFPLSAGNTFKPGAEVTVNAGYGSSEKTIFQGVVVRHGIKFNARNFSRLVLECRDKAVKMTIGRNNANFVDSTDSDIIGKLIKAHAGLSSDVDATTVSYKEQVQYYCTDWDFMLSRAEANGLLVFVDNGKVSVKDPRNAADSGLSVGYGDDLMEFDAEVDAASQYSGVEGASWDLTKLALVSQKVTPVSVNSQGDLTSDTLAKVVGPSSYRLQTVAPKDSSALKQWATGCQIKAGLAKIRGSMKFQGSALAKVGTLIELSGVGARFKGKALMTAVVHDISDGNWTTSAEFGLAPDWFAERRDLAAPSASGLFPGVEGLQIGIVKKLAGDPEGQSKIQVSVPLMAATTDGVWARLSHFHASNQFGSFFVPEVGDEVILGYFNNDPSHPVILGSLYSSGRNSCYSVTDDNFLKAIVTKSKLKLEFNDEKKIITVTTPANNKIVISDDDKSIVLQDQTQNKVTLNSDGISLSSPKDISIQAQGKITLKATDQISVTSQADVKVSGMNVNNTAQMGFVAKGSASAELSASGQTTVKGAMVMIN